jgi:hypothetical protein
MDRLHQYCRCVDGLILSQPGSGLKQFKSRTELFIGPRDHELMGQLYAIRSDIEHLNEHKYLEVSDRAKRLELVQKEVIAEQIARNALAHIIANLADLPDGLRRSFGTAHEKKVSAPSARRYRSGPIRNVGCFLSRIASFCSSVA